MKRLILLVIAGLVAPGLQAQINAKLIRYMDVSDSEITFVYGGDVWIMPKTGGQAVQITHSPGEESWPKFSPDGTEIAFTANYNGNPDVYVMPSKGGVPVRVTYASFTDRLVDWHPDGKRLLFASPRESSTGRTSNLYLVDKKGGLPVKLPMPYGELASFSPDGNKIAYITKITENYPFKRYRGGLTSDIIVFDLATNKAENITSNMANDGKPAWAGNQIYFLSDQDADMRLNVWAYDTQAKTSKKVTQFKDFDITYMSAGPRDLVFENGGTLYRMDLSSSQYQEVKVDVVSDLSTEIPRAKNVEKNIVNATASPGGTRLVIEARGELFNVPVKEGFVTDITKSSGAFDHDPAWSPDGKSVAYWSDKSGEYEVYLQDMTKSDPARKLTNRGAGFGYRLFWSPDNKWLAYFNEKNDINVLDVTSGAGRVIDNYSWEIGHGGRNGYNMSWSPDSKWLAYVKGEDNGNEAIFLYSVADSKSSRVTGSFYNNHNPVFSKDGKYLFFLTDRDFHAVYSSLGDGTWIYPNNVRLAAISLTADAADLMKPKNDEVKDEKADKKEGDKKTDEKKTDDKSKKGKEAEPEKKPEVAVKIDWPGIESRTVLLSPDAGNLDNIMAFEGKVVYQRYPLAGDFKAKGSDLMVYDLEKREEKKIIGGVTKAQQTADHKSLLVKSNDKFGVIKAEADQKIETPVPTVDLVMNLNPKEEWREIFNDTWRRYRDFFYDKDMQKVDWNALRTRYGSLIDYARSRWDVSNLQSNLQAELSAGHTYTFGGDAEAVTRIETGFLGIDWELNNNMYRIKRIVRPADYETGMRSPLDRPGVNVQPGEYILAVNGIDIDPTKEAYAAFEGLGGKTVVLSVSKTGTKADARNVVVTCLKTGEEQDLRYAEWIENNRKMVEKLSGGALGYIYMANTGGQGQQELVRMFYGQLEKKGFIIDERFNGGGQLSDRFLELLNRPVVYNLYWRHGRYTGAPTKANPAPMGMVINGWAGSGGDALPWAFREQNGGPIIGERTLGILVGPATGHELIDGGGITIPEARLYHNSGKWFDEGVGTKPDIEVWDDPTLMVQGRDPQMERAVEEVMKLVNTKPFKRTPPPAMEDRTAGGINGKR
ncbi:MAG: PD40 domain-containing protein [Bacteroidetes bacterium]|nr:PD40 domain-containing protein [Bacteroidota bacterium]